jgi:serpin B
MKRLVLALLTLFPASVLAEKAARADRAAVVKGDTEFALDLYGKLRSREGNLFLSPFSISTALAMTSAGARGKTLEQMTSTLHLPDQRRLHPALAALMRQVNAGGAKRGYQLSTANALWGQKGHPFLPAFVKLNRDYYGAGLREVDFAANAEGARETINDWVEKQTRDRIKDLITPGMLDSDTRLVLTNAIYFKGGWQSQFKKDRTRTEDFTLADGKKVQAPLMHQRANCGYLQQVDFQALEMPYAGKDLSMVVLLPAKPDGLPGLERALKPGNLAGWLQGLRQQKVDVTLPRFKLTVEFELKRVLADLGMPLAFEPGRADFSGIDGTKKLYISVVAHKAFVDVNEKGTEAAAATGVGLKAASARPLTPVFRADRPFLFLIRDKRADSILFLGRLTNPTK